MKINERLIRVVAGRKNERKRKKKESCKENGEKGHEPSLLISQGLPRQLVFHYLGSGVVEPNPRKCNQCLDDQSQHLGASS